MVQAKEPSMASTLVTLGPSAPVRLVLWSHAAGDTRTCTPRCTWWGTGSLCVPRGGPVTAPPGWHVCVNWQLTHRLEELPVEGALPEIQPGVSQRHKSPWTSVDQREMTAGVRQNGESTSCHKHSWSGARCSGTQVAGWKGWLEMVPTLQCCLGSSLTSTAFLALLVLVTLEVGPGSPSRQCQAERRQCLHPVRRKGRQAHR